MIHYTSFMRPIAALLIAVAIPVSLSGKENRHEQKRDHHFTFKKEPLVRFVKNGPGVVTPYGNNTVYNLRAVKLSDFGDSIVDVEITPFSYVVITKGKKHNAAKVMNPIIFNGELHNFKYKNIGSPTAVTFTPDMRQLLLATDKGVLIMGSQRYQVTDTIEVPFTVRDRGSATMPTTFWHAATIRWRCIISKRKNSVKNGNLTKKLRTHASRTTIASSPY